MDQEQEEVDAKEEAGDRDAAPEDVSLSRGREEALRTRRATFKEAKRVAERMKERRKRRQQLYKTQKDAKEERKERARFPEADLKKLREMEEQVSEYAQEENPEETALKLSRKSRRKNRQKSKKAPQTERHFGPVKVEALQPNPNGTLPPSVGREAALNFLHQQLYQNNRYRRISAVSFHSQKYRDKPAAIFV